MRAEFRSTPLPPPLLQFNMAAHVLRHAPAQPDKLALQVVRPTGAERWSYARLEAAVRGAGATEGNTDA